MAYWPEYLQLTDQAYWPAYYGLVVCCFLVRLTSGFLGLLTLIGLIICGLLVRLLAWLIVTHQIMI
jgi:hypothetical protein